VISSDDPGARRIRERMSHRTVISFGEDPRADVLVEGVRTDGPVSFTLRHRDDAVDVRLSIPGHHNAINAAGAVAVLLTLGYSLAEAAHALEGFAGTARRFELHGVQRGVSVYDDYAHHPTEVAAALAAARTVIGDGRIIALHQPHTYSRTRAMFREFAEVLESHADHTVVLDVYGAREDPVPGVTGQLVSDAFADPSHVHFVADWQEAADYTASVAGPGDYVVTLGCGNVNLIVPQVLDALARTDAPVAQD
jgi:UDP-N-acetylmuramate--alanine ligase